MNTVGMYQDYTKAFQQINQAKSGSKKPEGKGTQPSDKPWAVYERTSTDGDIKKAMEKREPRSWEKKEDKAESTLENFTISSRKEVKLSEKAQKVLDQLKEKYGNMDFFVADFSTDEEAQQYLSQGTKEYSVLIDPDTLEQMAEDEEVFNQYDEILAGAGNTFEQVKDQLGEDADKVASLGITIDKDGKVNLFAELDKQSVKMVEAQKKMREEKAEAKKEQQEQAAEKAEEKKKAEAEAEKDRLEERKTFRVTGSTVEELVDAIKNAVWE